MVKSKSKRYFRECAPYFLVVLLMFTFLSFASFVAPDPAYADNTTDFTNGSKIGSGATGAVTDITTTLKEWILVLRIVGAVVAVFGIVIGAITFSVSMGNAQRRSMGTGSMLSAIIGIIIIAKAPMLADYFISKAAVSTPVTPPAG